MAKLSLRYRLPQPERIFPGIGKWLYHGYPVIHIAPDAKQQLEGNICSILKS